MLTQLFATLAPWIVGILGALLGAAGLYFGGKKAGKSEAASQAAQEKASVAVAEAKAIVEQATETAKGVTDVQAEVNRLNTGAAADKLRNEWARDRNEDGDGR